VHILEETSWAINESYIDTIVVLILHLTHCSLALLQLGWD